MNAWCVVTSIAGPNEILAAIADTCARHELRFVLIGDVASPADFHLAGCTFLGIEEQQALSLEYARLCPTRHYARKNIGYLLAMGSGAAMIYETDDDNTPGDGFLDPRDRWVQGRVPAGRGWQNVYDWFGGKGIWPRGMPLEDVQSPEVAAAPQDGSLERSLCPIQQGLVDGDPDVDAICRQLFPPPRRLMAAEPIVLPEGAWCPFNSQNTVWWAEAFPLMYLPASCSFRMTDILRSFVAQRICWECGWRVAFQGPTAVQMRNEHRFLDDFKLEISGYLRNGEVRRVLDRLDLEQGSEHIGQNMRRCYQALVELACVEGHELDLLDAWLADTAQSGARG